jgi:phosphotransferase system HPr-like phosphotransfer protein
MKLKARHGETVAFEAEGRDAADAVRALVALVERNFDE